MKKLNKNKEIERLLVVIREKDRKIAQLEDRVDNYRRKFEDMQQTVEKIPDDCTPGEYCKACVFSKSYFFRDLDGHLDTLHFCGKADTCKNFVQREAD